MSLRPRDLLDTNICIYLMKHQPPQVSALPVGAPVSSTSATGCWRAACSASAVGCASAALSRWQMVGADNLDPPAITIVRPTSWVPDTGLCHQTVADRRRPVSGSAESRNLVTPPASLHP